MAGRVASHLLVQAGESRAPWAITTVVSCPPVLVLGMGTALAHMLRGDAPAADHRDGRSAGAAGGRSPGWSAGDQPADPPARTTEPASPPGPAGPPPSPAKRLNPDPRARRTSRRCASPAS